MGGYRVGWLVAAAPITILGVLGAVLDVPLGLWILIVLVCPMLLVAVWQSNGPQTGWLEILQRLRMSAPPLAVAGIAASGLLALAGVSALALIGVAVATSPWVVRRWDLGRGASLPPAVSVLPEGGLGADGICDDSEVASRDPRAMSDQELCLVWRASFPALVRATSAAGRVERAVLRASLLDEIQRRNPEGFARWMASGARAASDPERYLKIR